MKLDPWRRIAQHIAAVLMRKVGRRERSSYISKHNAANVVFLLQRVPVFELSFAPPRYSPPREARLHLTTPVSTPDEDVLRMGH